MLENTIIQGDTLSILKTFPDESVNCIVTSPPYYGLRDYGMKEQIGLERTLEEYLEKLLTVTAELKRVLKSNGTMFWNHGDSYGTGSGSGVRTGKQATNRGTQLNTHWQKFGKQKIVGYEKSLIFQNFRLVQRMVDEQKWILRNVIIWHKPNVMPSSAKDRFTIDFEPIFFLTKSKNYWFKPQYEERLTHEKRPDAIVRDRQYGYNSKSNALRKKQDSVGNRTYIGFNDRWREHPTMFRNKRCVISIPTKSSRLADKIEDEHFAIFPETLVKIFIEAGCPDGEIVLDPFTGSGTTLSVARSVGRRYIGIELNPGYVEMIKKRLSQKILFGEPDSISPHHSKIGQDDQ